MRAFVLHSNASPRGLRWRGPAGSFTTIAAALLVAALIQPSVGTQTASFQGLGFFPGGVNSFGLDVSGDGAVVGGKCNNATVPERAFRWTTATGLEDLGTLGGDGASARGASADGFWIVGRSNTATFEQKGFRWSSATGMFELPMADAADVSDDGSVIVAFAIRWKNGQVTFLPNLGGCCTDAHGVSRDGVVVVGSTSNGNPDPNRNTRAFRWSEATGIEDLGTLRDGFEAIAEAQTQTDPSSSDRLATRTRSGGRSVGRAPNRCRNWAPWTEP